MLVLIIVVLYVLLRGKDVDSILAALKNADKKYILICVAFIIGQFMLQSLSIYILFRVFGYRVPYLENFRSTLVGYFYNSITPSAGGGQPMQVFYFRDYDVPIGASGVALLLWTTIYKVALLVIQVVLLIFKRDFIFSSLGAYSWMYFLGMGVNIFNTVLYSVVVFWPTSVRSIVDLVMKLVKKLRFIKHQDKIRAKIESVLDNYAECSKYISRDSKYMLIILLITIIQRCIFFLIGWGSIRALGYTNVSVIDAFILQSLVSVCIDIMPVPGGAGMNESFNVKMFGRYIGAEGSLSAMLINRGVTFYIMLIICAGVAIYVHMRHTRKSAEKAELKRKRKEAKKKGKSS